MSALSRGQTVPEEGTYVVPWHHISTMDQDRHGSVRDIWWRLSADDRLYLPISYSVSPHEHQQQHCSQADIKGIQHVWCTIRGHIRQWTTVHWASFQENPREVWHQTYNLISKVSTIKWTGRKDGVNSQENDQEVQEVKIRPWHSTPAPACDTNWPDSAIFSGDTVWATSIWTSLPSHQPIISKENHLERNEERQKQMANQVPSRSELPPLFSGQTFRILNQDNKTWFPGTVTKVLSEPRSYKVSTPNRSILRCKRSHPRDVPRVGASPHKVHFEDSPSTTDQTPTNEHKQNAQTSAVWPTSENTEIQTLDPRELGNNQGIFMTL